ALRKDRTHLPIELSISSMELTDEAFIICVVRDISERKRIEQLLMIRNAISRILAEFSTLDEIASKILYLMCTTLKFEEGALWKVDTHNNILRCVDVWSIDDPNIKEFCNISKQMTFKPGIGL